MENSEKIYFQDDAPQWYVALGDRGVGPMTASDIYEKILSQELSWAHYVWKKGQGEWKRICDIKFFQAAVPHVPAKSVQKEVRDSAQPTIKAATRKTASQKSSSVAPPPAPKKETAENRIWFLHYNDSQFGPFSQDEVSRFLKIKKIHPRVHAWREGMSNWQKIEAIAEFQGKPDLPRRAPPPVSQKKVKEQSVEQQSTEQREHPRRPLIAKILMSDEHSVIVGVCRDISVGGLQVLAERIPAQVGARLKMNISPSSNASGQSIDPFVAEGVIVRILEDGRGFSFRFERLSDRAKQAIESYIESPF
jgi:hypothetical protein